MDRAQALALLTRYYAAFNAGDWQGMLDCLDDDVVHDINQGERQHGKAAFAQFLAHMERCYRERLEGIVLPAGAFFGLADGAFPDDGVVAIGTLDQPQWVFGEIDLARVGELRAQGGVLNLRHWAEQPGGDPLPPVEVVDLR